MGGWGAVPIPQWVGGGLFVSPSLGRVVSGLVPLLAPSPHRWPLGKRPLGHCQASSHCGRERGGTNPGPPPHPPPASQRAAGGCLVLPVPPAVKIKLLDFTNLMRLTWLRYTFLLGLRADGCGTRRGQLAGGQAWGGGGVCVADVGCCPNVASQHTPGRDVP